MKGQRQSKDGQNISSKLLGANLADINIEKFRDLTQYNKDSYEVAGKFTIPLLKVITNKFSPAVMFSIVLPNQAISNIDPISECVNLMILNLNRNAIENIRPLSKLKKLKIVLLADNAIMDPDQFENCQDLVNIHLEGNMVKGLNNLTSLVSCSSLKNIHFQTLSGNQQNPICELKDYRKNVFEFLPQLNRLDSVPKGIDLSNGSQLKVGKKKEIKMQLKSIGPFYTNKFPSTGAFIPPSFPGEQSFKKSVSSCKSQISQLQMRLRAAMAL